MLKINKMSTKKMKIIQTEETLQAQYEAEMNENFEYPLTWELDTQDIYLPSYGVKYITPFKHKYGAPKTFGAPTKWEQDKVRREIHYSIQKTKPRRPKPFGANLESSI